MKQVLLLLALATCTAGQNAGKSKPADNHMNTDAVIRNVRALRDHMKDPESFRVNSVFTPDIVTICVDYRSKNSLGGYVNGHYAVLVKNAAGDSLLSDPFDGGPDVWEFNYAVCKDDQKRDASDKRDFTDAVKAALKADREKE